MKPPAGIDEHHLEKAKTAADNAGGSVSPEIHPATAQEKKQAAENAQLEDYRGEVDPLTRRLAMQSFLRKMHDQLDVEPEKLVESFFNLQPHDLLLPPEETIDRVISQLDLTPDQMPVARALFEDLLNQTASSSMAEYLKSTGKELNLEVLSRDQIRQRETQRSLDRLNQQFFVDNFQMRARQSEGKGNDPQAKQAAILTYQQANAAYGTEPSVTQKPSLGKLEFSQAGQGNFGWSSRMEAMAPSTNSSASDTLTLDKNSRTNLQNEMETTTHGPEVAFMTGVEMGAESGAENMNMSRSPIPADMAPVGVGTATELFNGGTSIPDDFPELMLNHKSEFITEFAQQSESGNLQPVVMARDSETDLSGDSLSGEGQDNFMAQGQIGKSSPSQDLKPADGFMINPPETTETDEAVNTRELVNQARFMVKKGGGEMKVQLRPEGLGEVNLKVSVENGQVQVEMVTENNQAKKILEKGLADLKATLMSHKLNVDGIKVDVSGQLSSELQQQQQEAERQLAHNFLRDFKHENQSFRRGFFDIPGARPVKSQVEDEADVILKAAPARRSQTARRLDLVA